MIAMPSSYHRVKTCTEKFNLYRAKNKTKNAYQTLMLKVVFWIHFVVYYDLNGQEAREP